MSDSKFLDKASRHWTDEREAKVTGGKDWPIRPRAAARLLRSLGLLNADASMPADAVRKFSQINHMVTLLLPQLEDLAERHAVVRVLDACCGTSQLTLLIGWLFRERFKKPVRVVGVDANAQVVKTSAQRATQAGLEGEVRFLAADVGALAWDKAFAQVFPDDAAKTEATGKAQRPHLLVSLHACDVASDLAIAVGLRVKADVMALAPCCHAELATKWKELGKLSHPFGPVFRTPNLRRETAAQVTDAMRLLLIRSRGYEVTATEFVPSEHTPKNRLLLCVRRGNFLRDAEEEYADLKASLGDQGIKLEELLLQTDAATGVAARVAAPEDDGGW